MGGAKRRDHEWLFFFMREVIPTRECWIWRGQLYPNGYGYFNFLGKRYYAHRFSYERFVGPIPLHHDIHHECGKSKCVNPCHLVPLLHRHHIAGPPLTNQLKEYCKHGHRLSPDNVYVRPDRWGRQCKICIARRQKNFQRRRRSHLRK